jgi:geranylgeranyl reductase family protein
LQHYDVIVVGAGPAGTTAARHCAKSNLKTLLLEKERIPRYKPCAGGVSLAAAGELDFPIPDSLIERRCCGMSVIFGTLGNRVDCGSTIAYMVTRSSFDAYLVEKAAETGAEVQDRNACQSISVDGLGVTIRAESGVYRANVLVGADGFHSRVLKSLRPGFDRDEIRFCVIAELPITGARIYKMLGDRVEINFSFIDKGYAWLFPKAEYISAGVGGLPEKSKTIIQYFRSYLGMHGFRGNQKIRGCFLPVSRFRHDVYTDRMLLVGDAAGFVDAFSGEGIRFAIASGRLAAQAVRYCHERNTFSAAALKVYQDSCRDLMADDLLQSIRLTDLLFRYPRLLLGTAVVNDSLLRRYLMTITGEISFCEYADWVKMRLPLFLFNRIFRRKKSI